jgi:sarcosine oxidase, subunit beta
MILIIGAGVIGASIAWHLASRGARDVRLIERGRPGEGSTHRATGGFRVQFGTAVNVHLSLLSREKLLRFEEEVGVDSGYRQAGYLFLASTEAQLRSLREGQAKQRSAGFADGQIISAADAATINPFISLDGIIGAAWCPTDGFIRARDILRGYLDGARRLGVTLTTAEVLRLHRENGRITAVTTDQGEISCEHVINAAGAWAGSLAALAGESLPVTPLRRQVAATIPTQALPASMPMTIYPDGFHLRERDGRVLLLWPDTPTSPVPFDATLDDAWLTRIRAFADERVPLLRDTPIDRAASWAGLYEMSPDKHAILGRSPALENFWYANGSSGHGVMHAPAIGQLVAEMILDGRTSIDVHALRPSRFAEGDPNSMSGVL